MVASQIDQCGASWQLHSHHEAKLKITTWAGSPGHWSLIRQKKPHTTRNAMTKLNDQADTLQNHRRYSQSRKMIGIWNRGACFLLSGKFKQKGTFDVHFNRLSLCGLTHRNIRLALDTQKVGCWVQLPNQDGSESASRMELWKCLGALYSWTETAHGRSTWLSYWFMIVDHWTYSILILK